MTVIPQLERELTRAAIRRRSRNLRAVALATGAAFLAAAAVVLPILADSDAPEPGGERPSLPAGPGPIDPGKVTVAVLNGTTAPGLAATVSDRVAAAGFKIGTITNFSDQQLAKSVVQYAPGHEDEAEAVGRRVGIGEREPVSPSSRALAGDATVIVIAGADKAAALLDSPDKQRGTPTAPNPPLADLLGVFRRERTAHDKANFTLGDLESSGDRQPGESPADSRRIDLPGGPVYLWRMRDGVCASWGNCLNTGSLAQLGVALAYGGHSARGGRSRLVEVSGIVIDGIEQVQLGSEHGDQLVVPVRDNVFHVDLSKSAIQPTRVLWRQDGRWHRQEISLP